VNAGGFPWIEVPMDIPARPYAKPAGRGAIDLGDHGVTVTLSNVAVQSVPFAWLVTGRPM
jgi:hypothetical protein